MKLVLTPLLIGTLLAADPVPVLRQLDARADHYGQLSRQIWEHPELGFVETRSSALHTQELSRAGFRIDTNIGGAPTAFTATWGAGKPVIGIMGEFDALPGLSQDAIPDRKVLIEDGAGHGCGHNLLGIASVAAAIAAKEYIESHKLPGTIRYFGTPAEEGGSGKVYMAHAGAFAGVDAVLAWHPSASNDATPQTCNAVVRANIRYRGVAAHAAAAPDRGRSALDGVMLMGMGIEMLREHVPQDSRIHYVITKGGRAPNIVPELAQAEIYVRHPHMAELQKVWDRVQKVAQGAATITETSVDILDVSGSWNLLPNQTLNKIVHRHLQAIGGVKLTPEDVRFAEEIRKSLPESVRAANPLSQATEVARMQDAGIFPASTDAGDISWIVPTAHFGIATFVPGVAPHTWQATACAGSAFGRKGMIIAAKALALTAIDLFENPTPLATARAEFDRRRAGVIHRSVIPVNAKPPLRYRAE